MLRSEPSTAAAPPTHVSRREALLAIIPAGAAAVLPSCLQGVSLATFHDHRASCEDCHLQHEQDILHSRAIVKTAGSAVSTIPAAVSPLSQVASVTFTAGTSKLVKI